MSNNQVISRVWKVIGKYKFFLIFSLFLSVISVLCSLYIPVLTGNAVDKMIAEKQVDLEGIVSVLIYIGILIAVTGIAQWLMNICNNKITFNVVRDLRNNIFDKIQNLPLRYIDSHSHGDTVSRMISDVDQFSDGLLLGFTQFFSGIVTILATLVFMFRINLIVSLIVVLITPLSLFVAKFVTKKTYDLFKKQSEIRGQQTSFTQEMIFGQKVVKAFCREKESLETFETINKKLEKCSLRAIFYSAVTNPATRFVNSIVYAGVGIAGAVISIKSKGLLITVGQLSCMLSYANQYTKPFNEISGVITELQNALACAGRIFEFIDEKEETPEPDCPIVIEKADGRVELENVYFSYNENKKLIEGLDLKVETNKKVAIVGPTGCGKTTLINLLMRFYDPVSGKISVSGVNITNITRENLRNCYGMVLQDTWLMNGTVKENISLGKPDADMSEIIKAAKLSHAHSFIKRLPNGYDTVLSNNGDGLSQGQKQLLCITRIMLCLPPMLILDEATSSIDTRTELKIQDAFSELMKGRTSFIVAHRLSTVKNADIILVMKDGKIIEQGSHAFLLEQNGFYTNLYNSQFAK